MTIVVIKCQLEKSLFLSLSLPSQLAIDSHVSHPEALEADYMKEVGSDDEFGPHQLDQLDQLDVLSWFI